MIPPTILALRPKPCGDNYPLLFLYLQKKLCSLLQSGYRAGVGGNLDNWFIKI